MIKTTTSYMPSVGLTPYDSVVGSDIIYLSSDDALTIKTMIKEKFVKAHHTRTISHLKNKGLWRTFVGTPRKEVTRKNRDDLIDYLYSYYKDLEKPEDTINSIFELCQIYRRNVLNRAQNTIERDRQAFYRVFDEDFRSKKIAEVTGNDIASYINTKSKELHLKERALKDAIQILNRTFDFAVNQKKVILNNPAKAIDIQNYYQNCDLNVKTSDEKIFTDEEISNIRKRVIKEMAEKDYDIIGYAILFSIETGVRVAEIPPLRWYDITDKGIHIHRQQRMTRIKGKGRTFEELPFTKNERRHPKGGRYFPLTDAIKDILNSVRLLQQELGISSEFIFCNKDGTWLNKETYSQRLRRMCRREGLNITNNHAFRMSLNSNVFIPMGIPVTQRAYLLGHTVETNERFYSHMRTESLTELKDTLNQSTHTHSHNSIIKFSNKKIRKPV